MRQESVLVVDDEPGMGNFLVKTLQPYCRAVLEAADVGIASAMLQQQRFDIVLLDNRMPGPRGIDWLMQRRKQGLGVRGHHDHRLSRPRYRRRGERAAMADFLFKPCRANQVLNAVRRSMELASLRRENLLLRHELDRARLSQRSQLPGSSPAIEEVRDRLRRVARLPTPVLISGGSGTGKEEAARFLHALSGRADRPFVAMNCATIPADMLEAELFGHAPRDADQARAGLFVSAEGGTVFFDEIAELPRPAQAALLRVLDKQTIRPVGWEREIALDLRFVFATGKTLSAEVEAGRFREDLLFRVNVLQIETPQLKLRGTDASDLAAFFMAGLAAELGLEPLPIDSQVRAALLRHPWPGNIRELRDFIERALTFGRFPLETLGPATPRDVEPLDAVQRRHILQALELAGGNRSRAAHWLGVSRNTIERKCARLGL